MKNYNELLKKLSNQITNAAEDTANKQSSAFVSAKQDTTSKLLNKIGLEVQRQGGY